MSADNSRNPPGDVVAVMVAPVLIMALVGSLVFFLLEVLYAGAHPGRMKWVLFFFVFGSVLAARIGMMADIAARSQIYGGILAILTLCAMGMYVEYPAHLREAGWLISLLLVAITWFSAYKLTWDCTFIDDRVGASGEGVLAAAGLDDTEVPAVERYRRQKKEDEPKRTPGVWVIYFSIAALPIFGLGQSLIPAEEKGRRLYSFWLMGIYVASGLGLLLSTSFLGLRLYLRRRGLRMPLAMTSLWLTFGGVLVVLLLVGGAILPRPASETKLLDLDPAGSEQREASRKNFKDGEAGKDQGDPQRDKKPEKDRPADRGNQGEKDKGDPQRDKPSKDQTERQGGKDAKDGPGKDGKEGKDHKGEGNAEGSQSQSNEKGPDSSSPTFGWLKDLLPILKIVVFVIFGLVILFLLLRGLLRFAAGFSEWARNLLSFFRSLWASILSLFGRKEAEGTDATEEEERVPLAPFEAFSNPFEDGRAETMPLADLVRYSFAALEAWARDRQMGRRKGETALELAARLGDELPALERDALRLAQLYAQVTYGVGNLPSAARAELKRFWETLERATAQPLSA